MSAAGRGLLVVVSAASGTGKTALCRLAREFASEAGLQATRSGAIQRNISIKRLGAAGASNEQRDSGVAISVSHTTRPPRGEERDGVDYRFVGEREFSRMVEAGEFAEWANVHGHRYGTAHGAIEDLIGRGIDVLLAIDVQGGLQLRDRYSEAVLVFLLPPSAEELARRLQSRRTDSAEVIAGRMKNALRELDFAGRYDYVLVNDDLDAAAVALLEIVRVEKLRAGRRAGEASAIKAGLERLLSGGGARSF